jgi:predicted anti-sigma-YlaC factor YlaD
MSKCCEEYEDILIDIYYGETEMSTEIKNHLENCSNCREFLNEMEGLGDQLAIFDTDIPIDCSLVESAFTSVDQKEEKKRNIIDLLIFMSTAIGIFFVIFVLAYKGYGKYLLYGQISVFFLAPFSLIAFLKGRRLKEGM